MINVTPFVGHVETNVMQKIIYIIKINMKKINSIKIYIKYIL
jgi:hypothetical protein